MDWECFCCVSVKIKYFGHQKDPTSHKNKKEFSVVFAHNTSTPIDYDTTIN